MRKRAVIVDSGCAPTPALMRQHSLELMGMHVILDGETHRDGEGLTAEMFYETVGWCKEMRTAPPTVWEILSQYESLQDKGVSEIVDIHFSGKMTQTVDLCRRAKEMARGLDITIIDTENVALGARLIVEKLLSLLETGKSAVEILSLLPMIQESAFMQISVTTLKHLVRGGRIGKAKGLAGRLLNMKPILGVESGEIVPVETVRGMEKACERMADNAAVFIETHPHNLKIVAAWGDDRTRVWMEKAAAGLRQRLGETGTPFSEDRVWPTIACHSGPEVFSLAVYGEASPIG